MSVLTIQQIIDSFGDRGMPPKFAAAMGKLDPATEIITKAVPARLLRFEEDEQAIVGVISDLRKDRDDEVLLPEGMDASQYSGIVLWKHDHWREDIPHARNAWLRLDPTSSPNQVIAKTIYLSELSELGHKVFLYRQGENPMGQSVGFRSVESVRKGETGYDEVFKAWLPRIKGLLKELGIKPSQNEFQEPRRFFTKWELWEYSDVDIGSNANALQVAVSKGIITPQEAKQLVSFEAEAGIQDDSRITLLEEQIGKMQATIDMLTGKGEFTGMMPVVDLEKAWSDVRKESAGPTLAELWEKTSAM